MLQSSRDICPTSLFKLHQIQFVITCHKTTTKCSRGLPGAERREAASPSTHVLPRLPFASLRVRRTTKSNIQQKLQQNVAAAYPERSGGKPPLHHLMFCRACPTLRFRLRPPGLRRDKSGQTHYKERN